MKRIILTTSFCLALAMPVLADDAGAANLQIAATNSANASTNVFSNELDRASYALGMVIGHNLKQQGAEVNFDTFARGFKDEQSGGATLLTVTEMQQTLQELQKTLAAKQQQLREEQAAENKKKGEEFLAANAKKHGIKVLPDGLQYKIITQGKSAIPGSNDVVTVNYTGTLIDGTEFDSSYKRGQPAEFPVNAVIRGWAEALEKMSVGSKWQLFIPADLAYGENGRPGIPPNSTLIFEVELISAKAPPPPPAPLTSDIIAVPSAAEVKKGKQPYMIKPEEVQKLQQQMQKTNR